MGSERTTARFFGSRPSAGYLINISLIVTHVCRLERQLREQKAKYEKEIAGLRRATKHRDRKLREKSEGILQRASEIEVDREQAVDLLRSTKLELVEAKAEIEQLREKL